MCASNNDEFVVKHRMRLAIANDWLFFFTAIGAKGTNVLNTPLLGVNAMRAVLRPAPKASKAMSPRAPAGQRHQLPDRVTVEPRFSTVFRE
jgi:hypothetical protein